MRPRQRGVVCIKVLGTGGASVSCGFIVAGFYVSPSLLPGGFPRAFSFILYIHCVNIHRS